MEKRPGIPEKLLKPYNPAATEARIYEMWERVVMPPPNVTGSLHLGHAAMVAIEDIMTRYRRMRGDKTLWLPGTDHAAIATQVKVEKILQKEEGKTRHDLGREEFLKRVNDFARQSHDTIVNQIKKLGASADWSREAYTLDETRSLAVRTAFKQMYDAGLVYRGERIVNWDPRLQTTVSDEEIVYQAVAEPLYYLKYGPFIIATARPETKFGDKYAVMHPADARYADYKDGQKIKLEWINGPITATIIKDEAIDMNFGTGAMTITPWHDAVDFDIAERHGLDKEQMIDLKGKILPIAGEFAGLHIKKARAAIVEKLQQKGLVEKIEENYVHNVATSERSGEPIEPQILRQWFVAVDKPFKKRSGEETTLKKLLQDTVRSGEIKIIPERFDATYFNWVDNLHDWCISRQIWFGHRIPVWYKGEEIYVGIEAPNGDGWEQDPDTLDTWFSSGLWTFSSLGWPNQTEDLRNFHPTTVLETGYDIIFFWIARMILMTGFLLETVPFRTVYLHGLVRDEGGKKMSKSLGNIIDPLEMVAKFGADAVRLSLIIGTSPGQDSKISENKIKAYKHFANKIWNASRYVIENCPPETWRLSLQREAKPPSELVELNELVKEVTADMDSFRYYLAGEKLYHYFWHTFADKIIEAAKKDKSVRVMLPTILITSLKLLHPFMPYITEEIWSLLPTKNKNPLIIESWPQKS
ncbi:MAG: valine--tRNA ligase [Candidatus Vogelbacteria bacterium]|nr:valine--tRNA ligase [Candidatus Vogelbacteria bacterium]